MKNRIENRIGITNCASPRAFSVEWMEVPRNWRHIHPQLRCLGCKLACMLLERHWEQEIAEEGLYCNTECYQRLIGNWFLPIYACLTKRHIEWKIKFWDYNMLVWFLVQKIGARDVVGFLDVDLAGEVEDSKSTIAPQVQKIWRLGEAKSTMSLHETLPTPSICLAQSTSELIQICGRLETLRYLDLWGSWETTYQLSM